MCKKEFIWFISFAVLDEIFDSMSNMKSIASCHLGTDS